MDLKWLLVRRITLMALVCLLAGSVFAVYRTGREAIRQNEELVDLVARQLFLQLSRIDRSTDIPERFPDWDIIASQALQPGQCISFRGVEGAVRRSNCAGIDPQSNKTPQWFLWVYEVLSSGNHTSERTINRQGAAQGNVIVQYSPVATAAKAWSTVAPLIGFSTFLVTALCIVIYVVIDRALRPTRDILTGLNRLGSGDLTYRLPPFRLTEFNRISEVFNALTEDLRKATSESADLARRLVDTQEQDRRHIARELHDEIAQKLSALSANAACLRTKAQREAPPLTEEANALESMASALMISLRRTLTYLRPQEIDDLGLVQSLRELVAQYNESAAGRTNFSIETTGDLEHLRPDTSAHVYRIVQEALTNASKHANARNVQVTLSRNTDAERATFMLSVIDDGAGPNTDANPLTHSGAGMIGMRERVVALSGKFAFEPLPHGGFGLQVEFPTRERDAR